MKKLIKELTTHKGLDSLDFSKPFTIFEGDNENHFEYTAKNIDDLIGEIECYAPGTYAAQFQDNEDQSSIDVHVLGNGYVIE